MSARFTHTFKTIFCTMNHARQTKTYRTQRTPTKNICFHCHQYCDLTGASYLNTYIMYAGMSIQFVSDLFERQSKDELSQIKSRCFTPDIHI